MLIQDYYNGIKDDFREYGLKPDYLLYLLGLNEETFELEEAWQTNNFDSVTQIEEAGDVLFYAFKVVQKLGNIEEFFEKYKIEDSKNNPSTLLAYRWEGFQKIFFSIHKNTALLSGLVKKAIRVDKDLDIVKAQALLSEIIYDVFVFLAMRGFSVNVCMSKAIEKRKDRIEKMTIETANNQKEKEATQKPNKPKKNIKLLKEVMPDSGIDISSGGILPSEKDIVLGPVD